MQAKLDELRSICETLEEKMHEAVRLTNENPNDVQRHEAAMDARERLAAAERAMSEEAERLGIHRRG